MSMRLITSRSRAIQGEVTVPGDKSISHRAAMLGAIAEGTTEITGFLMAQDTLNTLRAMDAMGVTGHAKAWHAVHPGRRARRPPDVGAVVIGRRPARPQAPEARWTWATPHRDALCYLLAGQSFSTTRG